MAYETHTGTGEYDIDEVVNRELVAREPVRTPFEMVYEAGSEDLIRFCDREIPLYEGIFYNTDDDSLYSVTNPGNSHFTYFASGRQLTESNLIQMLMVNIQINVDKSAENNATTRAQVKRENRDLISRILEATSD